MTHSRSGSLAALGLVLACGGLGSARAGELTLYRDSWGVPHIYADTQEGAAYGHGYAQAEDRLGDVLAAYLAADGRAASVFGEDRLGQDFEMRRARHAEIARARYADLKPRTRQLIEGFVAGIGAYMKEHPEEVPPWAKPPEPHQVVALYRAFIWTWPLRQALADLGRPLSQDERGSNQWVVGPSRSAVGAPIALIDPHLSWEPQNRLYEAHVHGGGLDFYGFSVIGTPIMAVGHTDVLSLACTTGGPDCADVYEERIDPEDPLQYEYEGTWRPIRVEELAIEVKTASGSRVEKRRVERTHHGPILRREDRRAFAIRTAYDDEVGIVDQWLAMVRARDLGDFLYALRSNQSFPQNIMVADVHGNTYYVRAGRVPVRTGGFPANEPLPGWTAASEWKGFHPLADLVQVLNPPAGYMQNCNVSPGTMMPKSPLTADRYAFPLYNSPANRSNSRGRRLLELLASTERMTVEQALSIAVDTHVDRAERWQELLGEAFDARATEHARLRPAVELLRAWNRRMDIDSRAAALFRFWMRECRKDGSGVPAERIEEDEPQSDEVRLAVLRALDRAVKEMQARIGRIDIPWGDVHRAGRGDRSWPVAGCRADGISTLRSVRSSPPDERGISRVEGGQLCTTVVVLRDGNVTSYSATPYGQSGHARSRHYTDQGEKLFSPGKLKPTWYRKADLLQNLESAKTLSPTSTK